MPYEAEFLSGRRQRLFFAKIMARVLFVATVPLVFLMESWEPVILAAIFLWLQGWTSIEMRQMEVGRRLRESLARLEASGVDATELRRLLRGLPDL